MSARLQSRVNRPRGSSRFAVLLLVVALHLAALALLRLPATAVRWKASAVTASLLTERAADEPALPVSPPELQRVVLPEFALPNLPDVPSPITLPPATPEPVAASAQRVAVAEPVMLGNELALSCPSRTAPSYPPQSRRMREQGTVLLRVELDEQGRVAQVGIARSSGSTRLDTAGTTVVRTWRCNPATRDGRPVRAGALQEFEFVLERRSAPTRLL